MLLDTHRNSVIHRVSIECPSNVFNACVVEDCREECARRVRKEREKVRGARIL